MDKLIEYLENTGYNISCEVDGTIYLCEYKAPENYIIACFYNIEELMEYITI